LKGTLSAYDQIKKAQTELVKIAPRYDYLEQERPIAVGYRGPRALYGTLFKYARLLTRAIDERAKPNGERIAAFRDSAKESQELNLFSTEPVYDDYEILRLTDSLTDFAEKFGGNDPLVKQVLAGRSPRALLAFSNERCPHAFNSTSRRLNICSQFGTSRSRRSASSSTVSCRSVLPGLPLTKVSSPSLGPFGFHFR